jgi:hypothetical protein
MGCCFACGDPKGGDPKGGDSKGRDAKAERGCSTASAAAR